MNHLELKGISKSYGPLRAVNGVDLTAQRGDIVALLGDNGAGKSTLLKMIAGAEPIDAGEMIVDGTPVRLRSPREAEAHGIEMVYQDLALVETLEVVQNLYLGRERRKPGILGRLGVLDKRGMREESKAHFREFGVKINSVRRPVEVLSGGQRQGIALARAYSRATEAGAGIVCLDEPTAALGVEQSAGVLDFIRELQSRGILVFIVTHNLPQALGVATRTIVMRQGRKVADMPATDTGVEELVALITGARG
ncbi:MAG: ATP-binding cassette domain-containing protein [Conexibacter sp.]